MPVVSKVTGIPIARIATLLMLGKKIKDFPELRKVKLPYTGVKEAVFPFNMFPEVDPVLGPEMRATGEVMGMGDSFGLAFAKSQEAAGLQLPEKGNVLITVADRDKKHIIPVAKKLKKLSEIRDLISLYNPAPVSGLPRFHGGLVGYISYDMVREIEDIPDKNTDDLKTAPMIFLLAETMLAFDHVRGKLMIIANANSYESACAKIDRLEAQLNQPHQLSPLKNKPANLKFKSNFTAEEFEAVVLQDHRLRRGTFARSGPTDPLAGAGPHHAAPLDRQVPGGGDLFSPGKEQ